MKPTGATALAAYVSLWPALCLALCLPSFLCLKNHVPAQLTQSFLVCSPSSASQLCKVRVGKERMMQGTRERPETLLSGRESKRALLHFLSGTWYPSPCSRSSQSHSQARLPFPRLLLLTPSSPCFFAFASIPKASSTVFSTSSLILRAVSFSFCEEDFMSKLEPKPQLSITTGLLQILFLSFLETVSTLFLSQPLERF